MAGNLNKVQLIGRLGRDPEIRLTSYNSRVAILNLATSERWKDKQTGEIKAKTEWHHIVIYSEGLVSIVEKYLKKGSHLYVEGQLETQKYLDQQGIDRWKTKIVIKPYKGLIEILDRHGQDDRHLSDNRSGGWDANRSSKDDLNDAVPF